MNSYLWVVLLLSLFFGACVLAMNFSHRTLGVWFSPLSLYVVRWGTLVVLVLIGYVDYDPIQPFTWFVVSIAFFAFLMGCFVPMLGLRRSESPAQLPSPAEWLRATVEPQRLKRSIYFLFFLGAAALLLYVSSVSSLFGTDALFYAPHVIRAAIAHGEVPAGFHFFYIMEIVGILSWLYLSLYGRKTPLLVLLFGVFSVSCLIFTTGKVNIIKAVVWAVVTSILLNIRKLSFARFSYLTSMMVAIAVSLFLVLSNWGGESYSRLPWDLYAPARSQAEGKLLAVYIYNSGQLPTLDKLLHDESIEYQYGKLTFLPVAKIVQRFYPEFEVPSHIGQFYFVPFPFNVATYLDVMFKDFGLVGVLIIPFLLGFAASYYFFQILHRPVTFWVFYLTSILTLWVFSSSSAASYLKPSYWFQLIVGYLIGKYVVRRVRQTAPSVGSYG